MHQLPHVSSVTSFPVSEISHEPEEILPHSSVTTLLQITVQNKAKQITFCTTKANIHFLHLPRRYIYVGTDINNFLAEHATIIW